MTSLDLVVCRHGNTFDPGDAVRWVGRNEDLPLVEKGLAQAEELGRALAAAGWAPQRIVASSLRRTRGHAERAREVAGWDVPVEADPRLDEIDYGPWGGLTTEEIEALGGGAALAAWSSDARWPAAFAETEAEVRARVGSFAEAISRSDGRVLVVSSNGVLRYLLDQVPGELARRTADGTFKLGTGRGGRLRHAADGWHVDTWAVKPDAILAPTA